MVGRELHVNKSTYALNGGIYLEICEISSMVRTLSIFKKILGDIAGALWWANFGRAYMPIKGIYT